MAVTVNVVLKSGVVDQVITSYDDLFTVVEDEDNGTVVVFKGEEKIGEGL